MTMDNRSWHSGDSSWHSGTWNEKKPIDEAPSFKFESEHFFSTAPLSRSSNFCPYSLRQNQLSLPYQYDLLLVYDPDDPYHVEKLLTYLRPQNLKIFDFARDAPPGMPQRKLLQSAFQFCRFTCIVITKKFTSNFWLQLRTDMSIQDMLDNEQKMYSVIVVVMDPDVKRADLPLDLATLSPLFFTDRFFEDRIKRAFVNSSPFPFLHPLESSKFSIAFDPPKYTNVPSSQFYSGSGPTPVEKPPMSLASSGVGSRVPREHGDGTFVMPPSIFPSSTLGSDGDPSAMHRAISVTINSTGCRQPQESMESSSSSGSHQFDLTTKVKSFFSHESTNENSENSTNAAEAEAVITYHESQFSSSNQSDSASLPGNSSSHQECDSPAFFSLGDSNCGEVLSSDFSDLEISATPLHIPLQSVTKSPVLPASLRRSNSLELDKAQNSGVSADLSDDSCVSLPGHLGDKSCGNNQNLHDQKKSRSMRSLLSIKLSRMSNAFKSKKT